MAQQLIAINGNEEFPYTLQPTDISEAMGLTAGIAPGGFNANGIIVCGTGDIVLDDSAWNNAVQIISTTTSVTLPTSRPTGAVIHFYSNATQYSVWNLNVSDGQFIYLPMANLPSTATTIPIPYTSTITVLSRGSGEIDIVGGSYIITNNYQLNNMLGNMRINPGLLYRSYASSQNLLENGGWTYGLQAGWNYSSSIASNVGVFSGLPNLFLYVNGPASVDYTITSSQISMPGYAVGDTYVVSGICYNLTDDANGNPITDSVNNVTVTVNFYDSSDTLLETFDIFTVPAGTPSWNLYSGYFTLTDTTTTATYATLVISGQTYSVPSSILFCQFKVENTNPFNLPTFFSDEMSQVRYSQNNLTGTGYQNMASGLIMQWGTAINTGQSGSTPASVTFPMAFPHGCFQVVMTDTGIDAYRYWTTNLSTTGFDLGAMETDASGTATYTASGDATGRYLAFGW